MYELVLKLASDCMCIPLGMSRSLVETPIVAGLPQTPSVRESEGFERF